MTIALIVPPAVEPLTLEEVKKHVRVENNHENDLISALVRSAREYVEYTSGKKLISQTWRQYISDDGVENEVCLKVSPVQAVTSVTAYDRNGNSRLLGEGEFRFFRGEGSETVQLNISRSAYENGLEVDLRTGFGELGTDVPDILKRAMLMLIAHWYEFRGAVPAQHQPVSIPPGFEALVQSFRRIRV